MKRKLISLSLLALSATMMLETPVMAATGKTAAASAYTRFAGNGYATHNTSTVKTDGTSLTSRTDYGVIYNDKYASSTDALLKKFNKANESLYMSEGLSDSFPYFDVDQYLEEYSDVKEGLTAQLSEEEKNDQDALRKAALTHYVQYGMLEGRDCGTAFNPVIALLAFPELYQNVSDLSADNVRNIFLNSVHADDTTEFSIYFYRVNDTEMLSIVRNKKDSTATKYSMKDVLADAGISVKKTSKASNDKGNSDTSDKKDKSDNSDDGSDAEAEGQKSSLPASLNQKAYDCVPYKLYSTTGDSSELDIPGKATSNYNLIKDKLTKKYTMMVYMCGTDLETQGQSLSESIKGMIAAAPKNMNIVLLLGGTDTYGNSYLNNTISKEKIGIYYLNTEKLPKDTSLLTYDELLTKDTLVNLGTFDATSIGDPALLSGFMNLSTDLFPADHYGLIMWNHGGGVIDGICSPDKNYFKDNKGFDISDLETALRSSDLIKKGGKLGMLSFDACLMGCSEIAYNLHNYYNYMYASEEIARGNYDYERIFSAIDKKLGEGNATDYTLIKALHDNYSYSDNTGSWHNGTIEYQATGATYDGAATEKYVTALNNMGKQLNQLIQVAPDHGKTILRTLAMARLKCDSLGILDDVRNIEQRSESKYADIGELTYFLKADLSVLKEQAVKAGESEKYINALDNSIASINALQKTGCLVMSSTWYNKNLVRNYVGQQAISIEDMTAKAPMSELWRKNQGTNASYGTSVYFPCVFNSLDETLNKYSEFYNGTALSDFSALITKINDWKTSEAYNAQKNALANELKGIRLFTESHIADYGDKTSPQYLVVKFPEKYDKEKRPSNSFGTPMYDALITKSGDSCVYAVQSVKDANGEVIQGYKKVALSNNISGEHMNLADSSMSIQINALNGYGIYQEGKNAEDELDYKLLYSESDAFGIQKRPIVTALNNDYAKDDMSLYKIVEGSYFIGDQSFPKVYHVFRKTDSLDTFEYKGSATSQATINSDGSPYRTLKGASQISFYNYYLHKTDDNSVTLECDTTDHVQATEKYNIGNGSNPIYLREFTLGSNHAGEDFFTVKNPNDFSYAASIEIFSYTGNKTEFTDIITAKTPAEVKTDLTTTSDAKTNTDTNANINDAAKTATNTDVNADTSTDTSKNEAADTNTNADTYIKVDTNTNTNSEANTEAKANVNTDTNKENVKTESSEAENTVDSTANNTVESTSATEEAA